MSSYVYVLATELEGNRKTYVGWTSDLDRRLKQHNTGRGAKSTRGRLWFVLYVEKYSTRSEAMKREWALKHDRSFRARLHVS